MHYTITDISILLTVATCGVVFFKYEQGRKKKQAGNNEDLVQESLEAMITLLNPAVVRGWNIIIQYNIAGAGYWHIEIADEKARLRKGRIARPDLVMMMTSETWMSLVSGKLSGEMAYLSGKMKTEGDPEIFLQHEEIFDRKKHIQAFTTEKATEYHGYNNE